MNVYKLIVKDTIEENILKLQEKKRELADQILEGEGLTEAASQRGTDGITFREITA